MAQRFEYLIRGGNLAHRTGTILAQDIEQRDRDLEDYLASLRPELWKPVVFENGWTNFGGGWQDVEYRRMGEMVQVRGVMFDGLMSLPAFTLPPNYRPLFDDLMSVASFTTPNNPNPVSGGMTIHIDGTHVPEADSNELVGTGYQFSVSK